MSVEKRRRDSSRGKSGEVTSYRVYGRFYPTYQPHVDVLEYMTQLPPGTVASWVAEACVEKMKRDSSNLPSMPALGQSPQLSKMDSFLDAVEKAGL